MQLADLEVLLGVNKLGKDAVALVKKHKTPLTFIKQGHPARYYPDVPKVEMNETRDKPVICAYFVHEMNHVKHDKDGTTGDSSKQSRDDFVNMMVNEEIEGTRMQYEFYLDISKRGLVPASVVAPDCYNFYEGAYKHGRKLVTDANPNAPEEDIHKGGLRNGAVMTRFLIDAKNPSDRRLAGGGTPPVTISYRELYGREWDKAQKKKTTP